MYMYMYITCLLTFGLMLRGAKVSITSLTGFLLGEADESSSSGAEMGASGDIWWPRGEGEREPAPPIRSVTSLLTSSRVRESSGTGELVTV